MKILKKLIFIFIALLSLIYSLVTIFISYLNYKKRDYEYSSRTGFLIRRNLSELDAIKEGCSSGLGKYEPFFQPYNQRNQYFTISINAGYFMYFLVLVVWDLYGLREEIRQDKCKEKGDEPFARKVERQLIKQLINYMFVQSTFFISSTDFTRPCIKITYPSYFLNLIQICSYVVVFSVSFLVFLFFISRKQRDDGEDDKRTICIKVVIILILIPLYMLGFVLVIGQLFGTVSSIVNSVFMIGKPVLEIVLLTVLKCCARR